MAATANLAEVEWILTQRIDQERDKNEANVKSLQEAVDALRKELGQRNPGHPPEAAGKAQAAAPSDALKTMRGEITALTYAVTDSKEQLASLVLETMERHKEGQQARKDLELKVASLKGEVFGRLDNVEQGSTELLANFMTSKTEVVEQRLALRVIEEVKRSLPPAVSLALEARAFTGSPGGDASEQATEGDVDYATAQAAVARLAEVERAVSILATQSRTQLEAGSKELAEVKGDLAVRMEAVEKRLEQVASQLHLSQDDQDKPLPTNRAPSKGQSESAPPATAEGVVIEAGKTVVAKVSAKDEDTGMHTQKSVEEADELSARRLDLGDQYTANESIWDTCLFIGLPFLGPWVSCVASLALLINIVIQVAFSMIVFIYMLEPTIGNDQLDGLLRFRAGVAHDVTYADKITMRSMASQICLDDGKLHLSGAQVGTLGNVTEFLDGGRYLSWLAQVCWMASIVKELNAAFHFARALVKMERGSHTKVVSAESGAAEDILEDTGRDDGRLVGVAVVTRLVRLSRMRMVFAICFIVVPRMLIASWLGVVGLQYLCVTTSLADLFLNAMALTFILELDELFYCIFIPRRAQTLMMNLEPLPVPHKLAKNCSGLNTSLKLLLVAGGVLLSNFLVLNPVFWRLNAANEILCGGERDFVYTVNAATGFVTASRSTVQEDWTDSEKAVLQVIGLDIEAKYGWDPGEELLALSRSTKLDAVISPPAPTIVEAPFYTQTFDQVKQMGTETVYEASAATACADAVAGPSEESTMTYMRKLVANESAPKCNWEDTAALEFYKPFCKNMLMDKIRTLCPSTCGCGREPGENFAGFFSHSAWGCPSSCDTYTRTIQEYTFLLMASQGEEAFKCEDVEPSLMLTEPLYAEYTASYLTGLFEYLQLNGEIVSMGAKVKTMQAAGALDAQVFDDTYIDFITTDGALLALLLEGNWEMGPGLPHPRNLKGCAFLASPEFKFILGLDLCTPLHYRSIRDICPISCGCGTMTECPVQCTSSTADERKAIAPKPAPQELA